MKLSDKIAQLRRSAGMSQEEMAEKLSVSRQAISRWEQGSAMPDASNLLQISRLFGITTDSLLDENLVPESPVQPPPSTAPTPSSRILFYLLALEILILPMQFITTVILKNLVFAFSTFFLFAMPLAGFEWAYRKRIRSGAPATPALLQFRRRFYQISAWLGLYFPTRFLFICALELLHWSWSAPALECTVLVLYISAALLINLSLEKTGDV